MGGFVKFLQKVTDCLGELSSGEEQYKVDEEEELAFTTFIIKVDPSKAGWQKRIIKLLQNCKGARLKMDGEGVVEVSGISRPMKLMKKIGGGGKAELQWIQYGQCCANLFMPQQNTTTKKDPPQLPLQHNNYYDHNNHPYNNYNPYGQTSFISLPPPPPPLSYNSYYQLPQTHELNRPYYYARPHEYY
ncbi:hypothetical protein CASFOL_009127 [Castilleja foliolosa]|uniref:Uncharacterized protein n=1 Tax=Castilleja foliolosa TaxID=1961234 RepID=A0ABD3E504_9LAMI